MHNTVKKQSNLQDSTLKDNFPTSSGELSDYCIIEAANNIKPGIINILKHKSYDGIIRNKNFKLIFENDTKTQDLTIIFQKNYAKVIYQTTNDAFRALGTILTIKEPTTVTLLKEKRHLEMTSIMLDVSRNAVIKPEILKQWIRNLALMGINGLMLYTEDTYQIDNEPYFGYMRGGYTKQEIKDIDSYAKLFGIEITPCIQTLAHMHRVLCHNRFNNIKDTASVLLCEEPKTYKFIETMIENAIAPYSTSKIHIGMDEALNLGRGNYLDKFGYHQTFDIMTKHLNKVMNIIKQNGLNAYMWSDMFFRASSPTGAYFDKSITFSEKMKNSAPPNINLVYWDYFHKNTSEYDRMIKMHRYLNDKPPVIAPGIHTWNRFWPAYSYTQEKLNAAIKSAINNNLNECIITLWGDDGTECDLSNAIPLIRYASDIIFTGKPDISLTETNLKHTMSIDYNKWRQCEEIDKVPGNQTNDNISKMLLWEDPLTGLCQGQKKGHSLNTHYKNLAIKIKKDNKNLEDSNLFIPYLLADILSTKADLPEHILKAYKTNDINQMKTFTENTIPKLINKFKLLKNHHREIWIKNNKPFGWDVLERRYGGTIAILDNLKSRLNSFINGDVNKLEELETERLLLFLERYDTFPLTLCYNHFFTTAYSGH